MREDIAAQLHLKNPAVLVGTFDRPNLTYRILPRVSLVDQVAEALRRHADRAAIVYCISRKDTESLALDLTAMGIPAKAYHAGLDAKVRTRVQAEFKSEKLNVVVATVAFGMGIDRGDVRCVIHAAMPKTVEHYQQETGRAGRDGLPAECLLLYSAADIIRWQKLMQRGADDSQADPRSVAAGMAIQTELLEHARRLCTSARCRHRSLSEYFGQEYQRPASAPEDRGCGACDVCLHELQGVPDSNDIARKILSCVYRVNQNFGAAHVSDVLRGSKGARVIQLRHHELSTYGLLRDIPKEVLGGYINQLLDQGVLSRSPGEYPVLVLNPESAKVLKGTRTVELVEPKMLADRLDSPVADGAPTPALSSAEIDLFESHRALRRDIAAELAVPPYVIFGDTTLEEMARVRPGSDTAFVSIKGVGQTKLGSFGPRFLSHIRLHCERNGLQLDAVAGSRRHQARVRESKPTRAPPPRSRRRCSPGVCRLIRPRKS